MNEMLKLKNWAVLGATDKTSRFGYKILKSLEDKGFTVCGVSPKYDDIEGIKVYRTIEELPEEVEGVNVIVNPRITIEELPKIKEKGIKNLWFQPGSFDDEVIAKAIELGFNIETQNCMYVELNRL